MQGSDGSAQSYTTAVFAFLSLLKSKVTADAFSSFRHLAKSGRRWAVCRGLAEHSFGEQTQRVMT